MTNYKGTYSYSLKVSDNMSKYGLIKSLVYSVFQLYLQIGVSQGGSLMAHPQITSLGGVDMCFQNYFHKYQLV